MSYPKALIYKISEEGFQETTYEDLEVVTLLKDFLNYKDLYLYKLFGK